MTFFTEIEQVILKVMNNHKRPQITKAILRRKNKAESITSSISTVLQSYNDQNSNSKKKKKTSNSTFYVWQNTRHTGQLNYTESPEINPCIYNLLIYDKGGKIYNERKDSFFNNWCWENWRATGKTNEIRTFPHTKYPNKFKMD